MTKILMLLFILFFGCINTGVKECFNDVQCFEDAAKTCTPAHVTVNTPNGSFEQAIIGRYEDNNNCHFEIYISGGPKDILGVDVKKTGIGCEIEEDRLQNFEAYAGDKDFSRYGECNTLYRLS